MTTIKIKEKGWVDYKIIEIGEIFTCKLAKRDGTSQSEYLIKTDQKGISGTMAICLVDGTAFSWGPDTQVRRILGSFVFKEK